MPDERPKIARVIYNRLHAGMNLGIDATTRYGLHVPGTKSLTQSELDSSNPYNTRNPNIIGLPPTPIANPGLASMQAAAHPAAGQLAVLRPQAGSPAPLLHRQLRRLHQPRNAVRLPLIGASTRLVALLGHPVAHSLSPRMQNAAFAARGARLGIRRARRAARAAREAMRGLAAAGFAGANVTIPHKRAAALLCGEADGDAVNTLVFADGRIRRLQHRQGDRGLDRLGHVCLIGAGGAAATLLPGLRGRCGSSRGAASGRPTRTAATSIVNATPVRDELLVEPHAGQTLVELAYGERRDGARERRARGGLCGHRRARSARRCRARRASSSGRAMPAPVTVMRTALGLPA